MWVKRCQLDIQPIVQPTLTKNQGICIILCDSFNSENQIFWKQIVSLTLLLAMVAVCGFHMVKWDCQIWNKWLTILSQSINIKQHVENTPYESDLRSVKVTTLFRVCPSISILSDYFFLLLKKHVYI